MLVTVNMVVKKKKEDEDEVTEVQEGWKGRILPFDLVQKEFHKDALDSIAAKEINKMLKELEAHNLIYRSHQGLRKPNKIYVYDLLKADNSNWLPKQFKHRKGQTNEKEIL